MAASMTAAWPKKASMGGNAGAAASACAQNAAPNVMAPTQVRNSEVIRWFFIVMASLL
jgi:hypothetical protein